MTEPIPAEFFENIEEQIVAANEVLAVYDADGFACLLQSCGVYCGLSIDAVKVEDNIFIEYDCWFMLTDSEKLDVARYKPDAVDLLIARIQAHIRWGKLVREDNAITLSRNELVSNLLDETDIERITLISDELILETQLVSPILQHLLGQESVTDELVASLLCEPEYEC